MSDEPKPARSLSFDLHPGLRSAIVNMDDHMAELVRHWSIPSRAQARMALLPGKRHGWYDFEILPPVAEEFFEQYATIVARLFQGQPDMHTIPVIFQTAFLVSLKLAEEYESIIRRLVENLPEYKCIECGEFMWEHAMEGPCTRVGCFCQTFKPGQG